jgi:hypothetical protein
MHEYGGSGDVIPLIYIRSITNSQVGGKSFSGLC